MSTRSRPERSHSHMQSHTLGEAQPLAQVQALLHALISLHVLFNPSTGSSACPMAILLLQSDSPMLASLL